MGDTMSDETVETHEVTFGYDILTAEEAGIEVTDEMRARAAAARDAAAIGTDDGPRSWPTPPSQPYRYFRIATGPESGIIVDDQEGTIPPTVNIGVADSSRIYSGLPKAEPIGSFEDADDDSIEGDAVPRR